MIRILKTILFVELFATVGMSYRFVCNGYLANGEERSDDCGVCDDEHAARWQNPNIPVVIGEEPLPANISENDWAQITKNSFAAWENVDGTNLKFVPIDSENVREFGANDDIHEIFWITDRMEWRKLVGNGEFGTLGATLPRYLCESGTNSDRVIFDADLVLNGLPHINWAVDCDNDDCISVQTTLVHELGHFFGLDHPCLMCSSSIMSARAGFDLVGPVFDDMEGLRVLYPNKIDSGGFGFPCAEDHDCRENFQCMSDGRNRYCSMSCSSDTDCDAGALCRAAGAKKMCRFVDGASAGGRPKGENCMKGPCLEPLVCAGAFEPNFYCFEPCTSKESCGLGEDCVKLEEKLSLCVRIKNTNESCNHRELCEDRLYCVFETENDGFCRAPCAPSDTATTGCGQGERCEIMQNRVEICMPIESQLALNENTDEFGQNGGLGKNRRGASPQEEEHAEGCSSVNQPSSWLWFIIALLALGGPICRRHEARQKY